MKNIKGVIFDLDGVIVSTDEYHYRAWKYLSDEYSMPFSRKLNEKLRGVSRMASLEIIIHNSGKTFSKEEKYKMTDLKNRYYVDSLKQLGKTDILPGVLELLSDLKNQKIKFAIGSSSKNAKLILEQIDLAGEFDYVVDGTQIDNSKPNPEVFLVAAKKLSLKPESCVVIEDADAGIEAAKRAGMYSLAVGAAVDKEMCNAHRMSLKNLSFLSLIKEI